MPWVGEPSSAVSSKRLAFGAARPLAIATWPRGMLSVCTIVWVAGSQSQ